MTKNMLFLYSMVHLEYLVKSNKGSEYGLLIASAIIRKFFIDGGGRTCLINQINPKENGENKKRKYVENIEFKIWLNDPNEYNWEARPAVNLIPDEREKYNPGSFLNQERFLDTPCLKIEKYFYTVRDIIQSAANYGGGVHVMSEPRDEKERNQKILSLKEDLWEEPSFDPTAAGLIDMMSITTGHGLSSLKRNYCYRLLMETVYVSFVGLTPLAKILNTEYVKSKEK